MILEQGHPIHGELYIFWKTSPVVFLGSGKEKEPDYVTSNDHLAKDAHYKLSSITSTKI